MTSNFTSALDAILRRGDPRPVQTKAPAAAPQQAQRSKLEQRREWFATFAAREIMPLLNEISDAARKHGADATARLAEEDGHLTAELVIMRGKLPSGARPPRLAIYPTDGDRPLMIEYTGTFPHVGATGGFGGEVDFDSIYPSQLEDKILDFVALANGAGTPLR